MGKITTPHMARDLKRLNRLDIDKLVEMYWQIEKNHWEEDGNPEDHIFHAINNLKNYLIGRKK
jgi:hypothetical protein